MVNIRWLPRPADYVGTWQAMSDYTEARQADTPDEIWLCEHPPVYTLGQAGLESHVLNPRDIPLIHTNRGGQVTYHGPGQVVAYGLIDLKRAGLFVRDYVSRLEDALITALAEFGVTSAARRDGMPGVYVPDPYAPDPSVAPMAKIAALGIKVRKGCAYHGVSLNVAMDLTPFDGINPCGYAGLRTVDMAALGVKADVQRVGDALGRKMRASIYREPV